MKMCGCQPANRAILYTVNLFIVISDSSVRKEKGEERKLGKKEGAGDERGEEIGEEEEREEIKEKGEDKWLKREGKENVRERNMREW